jgi:DMSO reductase anchor subunit
VRAITATNSQSVAHNTAVTVKFGTEVEDTLGEFDPSTSVFTAKDAGVYSITANVEWMTTAASVDYYITILRSGSGIVYVHYSGPAAVLMPLLVSASVNMTAGQTISIAVYQNSGVTKTIGYSFIATETYLTKHKGS